MKFGKIALFLRTYPTLLIASSLTLSACLQIVCLCVFTQSRDKSVSMYVTVLVMSTR